MATGNGRHSPKNYTPISPVCQEENAKKIAQVQNPNSVKNDEEKTCENAILRVDKSRKKE